MKTNTNFILVASACWLMMHLTQTCAQREQARRNQVEANIKWQYLASDDSNTTESARSVWLTKNPGEDLDATEILEKAKIDPKQTKYGEFQYGGVESRMVSLAVERDGQKTRLFVDQNRDRKLSVNEEVQEQDGKFLCRLDAEFGTTLDMTPIHQQRTIRFRRNPFGESVTLSTIGCLSGKIRLDSKGQRVDLVAKVFDSNCNGRFGDADDGYFADFDQDGKLNPFTERKEFGQVLTWNDSRFLLLKKRDKDFVLSRRIEGEGTVKVELNVDAKIVSADMLLTGNDGNVYSKSIQNGSEFKLPTGDYVFSSLSISLLNSGDNTQWHYCFSAYTSEDKVRQFVVSDKSTTVVSPLKKLKFKLLVDYKKKKGVALSAGDLLTIRPTLFSESGLMINNCWTGDKNLLRFQTGKAALMRFSIEDELGDIVATSGFK